MDAQKRKRLEAAGWRFGDAEDFLELTEAERRIVDLRAKLGAACRRLRSEMGLTQKQVAARLKTSQARVVDIEANVSTLDLMFRAFYTLGGDLKRLDALGAPLSAEARAQRVRPAAAAKRTRVKASGN